MSRDNCFDFLRLLFALIVAVEHWILLSGIDSLAPLAPVFNTTISVTGFFVISGFLISQSYERSTSVGDYLLKRCRRLLPAYWLVVLLCAFGLYAFSCLPASDYFFTKDWWTYLLANLAFLNFLQPDLPGVFEGAAVNPALWTLKVEVAFYLCLPFFVWLLRRTERKWLPLMIIYILGILYSNVCLYLNHATGNSLFFFLSHQLPGCLPFFAVGMALYYYRDWFMLRKNWLIVPALVIWLAEYNLPTAWLGPAAFGVMVIWCAYSLKPLNHFVCWGDISYGVYIYHGPIVHILTALGLTLALPVAVSTALYLACVITVALLSWHLCEKRILQR